MGNSEVKTISRKISFYFKGLSRVGFFLGGGGHLSTETVTGRLTEYSDDVNVLSICVNNGFMRKFFVFIYVSMQRIYFGYTNLEKVEEFRKGPS